MQAKDTDRTKFDDRDYMCVCYQCGETFEATRSDASFCSAKCRVRHSREPQKLLNAIAELEAMRTRVNEISRKYPTNDKVFKALQELRGAVDYGIFTQESNKPD